MKNLISLLLALLMLTSIVACGGPSETETQTDPGNDTEQLPPETNAETEAETEPEKDDRIDLSNIPFVPVTRFIVTSDIHITPTTGTPAAHLKTAIGQITEYFQDPDKNDGYSKLDAIAIVGDITNNGTTEEFNVAKKYFDEVVPVGTELVLTMGNHDWNKFGATSQTEFEQILGPAMLDIVIGGYHFITIVNDEPLGWRGYGWDYSQKTLEKAEKMIQRALADTGKDKPIFVFQHLGNLGTVVSTGLDAASSNTAVATLTEMQSQFPNLVVFSGHSHFPINDECSIHQRDFTSINTGSLSAAMTSRLNGKSIEMASRSQAKAVYLIEVDEYGRMKVRIWRTENNGFMGEEWFVDSYRKDEFVYTEDRFSEEDIFFANGAEVSLDCVFSTNLSASFLPVPEESLTARIYEAVLTDKNGNAVATQQIPLEYYVDNFTTPLQIQFNDLQPETEYTLSVYALNSLYSVDIASEGTLRSKPLTATFTTPQPEANLGGADIINVKIDAKTNTVKSIIPKGLLPTGVGSPNIYHDESIGMDVVSFDGTLDNVVKFSFAQYADAIKESMSFETYIRLDEKPSSPTTMIGAAQSGGFCLNARTDGKFQFQIRDGEAYDSILFPYQVGRYYHIVVSFDGATCTIYADGVKVGATEITEFQLPRYTSHYWLYLGADVYNGTTGQNPTKCTVAKFAMYSEALTAEKVTELYTATTAK